MSSEALRLSDWLQGAVATYPQVSECEPGGYCSELDQRIDEAVALLRTQAARIAELERLCDATYVAQGADAYNHATDEMERFQRQRLEQGKEAGCGGSLCDGMAWLYGHIASLESERDQLRAEVERLRKPLTPDELADLCESWLQKCQLATNIVDAFEAGARAIEAAKESGEHE